VRKEAQVTKPTVAKGYGCSGCIWVQTYQCATSFPWLHDACLTASSLVGYVSMSHAHAYLGLALGRN